MVAALSAFLLPFVDFDRGALKTIGTKSKLAKIENNISGEQMSRVVKVSIARLLSTLFASPPLYRSPTLLDSTSPTPHPAPGPYSASVFLWETLEEPFIGGALIPCYPISSATVRAHLNPSIITTVHHQEFHPCSFHFCLIFHLAWNAQQTRHLISVSQLFAFYDPFLIPFTNCLLILHLKTTTKMIMIIW